MRSLLLLLLASISACSVVNRDHCGNLDGDATCVQRDPSRPFCSACVADNEGCLAQAPAPACGVTSAGPGSTGATSSSSGDLTSSSTTDTSPTTTGTTTEPPHTTSTTTGTSGSSDDTGTTATAPVCGDNQQEGEEVCDGTDLADKTCATLLPDKWGGGTLACNECASFDDSGCCVGVGQKCDDLAPVDPCCPSLECTKDMLPSLDSHCQNP
jgi:hypothetical protein